MFNPRDFIAVTEVSEGRSSARRQRGQDRKIPEGEKETETCVSSEACSSAETDELTARCLES